MHKTETTSYARLTPGPLAVWRTRAPHFVDMMPYSSREKRWCPSCRALYVRQMGPCPTDGSLLVGVPEDPLIGTVVGGRYQVVALLREEKIGRVYRAVDPMEETSLEVKVMHGEFAANERARLYFVREATLASMVSHPNVVPVIDVGETCGGMPFLAMPQGKGCLLTDLIKQDAPLPPARALAIFRGVCSGVAEIHRRGLVHWDLRASNISCSLGEEESAEILGLGIALAESVARESFPLHASLDKETLAYMAPERFASRSYDPGVDLFSLGVLLYHMLSGALPFEGSALQRAIGLSRPAAIGMLRSRPGSEPGAEAIAMRLIEPNPGDRYADVESVIAAIDALSRLDKRGERRGDYV